MKTLSAKQALSIRKNTIVPGGIWTDCIGEMDRHGVVFFWGNSGQGKTSAVVSFCKELCAFGNVLYVSLEEGFSLSMQNTLRRFGMQECGTRFQIAESMSMAELEERLKKQRSPEFIVIDSFQYAQMSYRDYIKFKEAHRNKLLIFISHADGKQPEGRAARSVKYDAGLKIWVEGHVAVSLGRFIGRTAKAVIWRKKAEEYWGTTEFGEGELVKQNDSEKIQ